MIPAFIMMTTAFWYGPRQSEMSLIRAWDLFLMAFALAILVARQRPHQAAEFDACFLPGGR